MTKWLLRGLLIVVLFATIWLVTIYYWDTSNRMPTTSDIVLNFIVLPISLILAFWLGKKAWANASDKSKEKKESSNTPETSATDSDTGITAENERLLSIAILGSAIKTAHASSTDELATTLKSDEGGVFDLDHTLTNDEGFPILTGRITDLDDDEDLDTLQEWLTEKDPDLSWSAEALRALVAGGSLINELAQIAINHPALSVYLKAPDNQKNSVPLPMLQMVPLFPKEWAEQNQSIASDWFNHLIVTAGWPSEKIISPQQSQYHLSKGISTIDQMMLNAFRQSLPCFSILLACESYIGEDTITNWSDLEKVYFGKSDIGMPPSEGAAGLLLADEQNFRQFESIEASKLFRPVQIKIDESAISSESQRHKVLTELIESALETSNTEAKDVALITADTDMQASKQTELMSVGYQLFPDLDPNEQFLKVTSDCGMLGTVSSVIALALAHHEASTKEVKVACISNIDKFARAVNILSPYPPLTIASET